MSLVLGICFPIVVELFPVGSIVVSLFVVVVLGCVWPFPGVGGTTVGLPKLEL